MMIKKTSNARPSIIDSNQNFRAGNKSIGFLNTKNRLRELKHIEFGGV